MENKKTGAPGKTDRLHKIRSCIMKLSEILETVAAILVAAAVVIALIFLVPHIRTLWQQNAGGEAFMDFLEWIFTIVIGVEFLKMLCRPTSDNVLDTLVFLVARHMIITKTTPLEDLLATVSIILLVLTRKYLGQKTKTEIETETGAVVQRQEPGEETVRQQTDEIAKT